MRHTSFGRFARVLSLLCLGLFASQGASAQPVPKGNFCLADSVARVGGPPPGRAADCPAGYTNQAGSCKRAAETRPASAIAAECPAGYKLDGNSCARPAQSKPNTAVRAADCPDGYSNSGSTCFRLSAPDPLPASRMTCKAGETKIDARCFKACEAGTTRDGANCVRPASTLGADNMSCKAGYLKDDKKPRCLAQCPSGFNNTGESCVRVADTLGADALSCKSGETRLGARCVAAVTSCGKGEVLQGGACFATCAAGLDGVGGACWPQAPKAWLACGIGAAKDAQSCAGIKLDPVAMVKHHAVALAREASIPAAAGQKVTRLVALHGKFRDLVAAYGGAKDTAQFKRDLAAWSQANEGKDALVPFDDPSAPITEPAMMRHAVQLSAIAGFSGAIDAGGYGKCSAVK